MKPMKRRINPFSIRENDLPRAWAKLLKQGLRNERPVVFGDIKDPKTLRGEIRSMVVLEGNAIDQILNGVEVLGNDPRFKFGPGYVQMYVNEYTMEYVGQQRSLPDGHKKKFSYTYYDRFRYYPTPTGSFDQIEALKKNLGEAIENGIFSNRHQMITWIPWIDAYSNSPPCLQRVWVTLVDEKSLATRLDWRSRDLYGAWHVNLVAVANMLQRDIARPLDCKIVEIVDTCDSLHIYNGTGKKQSRL
ncbi:MAG: thymidylate synthase [Candidatus Pacebacteria bacterium]|nr:thymidylate synthase [Candidatus Paceibacterota bacterium]